MKYYLFILFSLMSFTFCNAQESEVPSYNELLSKYQKPLTVYEYDLGKVTLTCTSLNSEKIVKIWLQQIIADNDKTFILHIANPADSNLGHGAIDCKCLKDLINSIETANYEEIERGAESKIIKFYVKGSISIDYLKIIDNDSSFWMLGYEEKGGAVHTDDIKPILLKFKEALQIINSFSSVH